jgi:hypothetical protein
MRVLRIRAIELAATKKASKDIITQVDENIEMFYNPVPRHG